MSDFDATDFDWRCAFGSEKRWNECEPMPPDVVPPGASLDGSEFTVDDVDEVIAAQEGENEGRDWVGLFRLKDGRFAVIESGCDYSGWD